MQLVKRCVLAKNIKLFSTKSSIVLVNGKVHYLFEWVEYYIEVHDKDFEIFFGDEKAEKISDKLFKFTFKNYIGKSRLEIKKNGKIFLNLDVEVISEKFAKIGRNRIGEINENTIPLIVENYQTFVEEIINELGQKALELPFSIEAPTGFEFIESDKPVSEFFAYHLLVNNRERIISAYEEITRRPHRKLVEREEWVNFWEVSEVDEDTVMSIITHPEYLIKAETSSIAVAEYLNNHVPTKVAQRIKYESFDTHENRFAKHFLNELITWGEKAIAAILTSSYLTNEQKENAISKLTLVLGELEYYATSDIFDDVGEMVIFPYTSQVLLKREGYRDLLQLWREFRGYLPFFNELQKAIDNKDIAKLYEYWCFFRLVEELGNILGRKGLRIVIEPTGELSEGGNVYALFDNGWRLYYNKRLTSMKWSYSVTLRPDYSLFKGNKLVGVFDAKFKFDIVDEKEEIENFDVEDEKIERSGSYTTWAKLEDIYKMHTYKDALNAKFAVVLYPGDKSVFFKIDGKNLKIWKLSDLVSKNCAKIEGIGCLKWSLGEM